jgi:osmotically-inducible protein OsmY
MKTDTDLQHAVMEALAQEPGLDAARIGIAAHDGVVMLTGHVTHYVQRYTAEDAAKRVTGVAAVANDIQAVEVPHRRDDTEIAEAAVHALQWDPLVPDDRIRVSVEHGWPGSKARSSGTISERRPRRPSATWPG